MPPAPLGQGKEQLRAVNDKTSASLLRGSAGKMPPRLHEDYCPTVEAAGPQLCTIGGLGFRASRSWHLGEFLLELANRTSGLQILRHVY